MDETVLLDEYVEVGVLAKALKRSERTIYRYENLPDGLPFVKVGSRKLYRIESVRRWIAGRERQANPTRQRKGGRQ